MWVHFIVRGVFVVWVLGLDMSMNWPMWNDITRFLVEFSLLNLLIILLFRAVYVC